MRADSRNRIGAWTASSTRIGLAARDAWTRLSTLLFFNRQLLSLLLVLGVQPGLVSWAGEQVDYGRVKGDALKEVLRPLPPKEPDEALRLLEVIEGFSVEYVAHEPLVLDPVAAAIDENGLLYVAEDADYPYRPKEGEKPLGRIRLLKDSDNDGYYEESHLFADGLLWPAGVAPWKGGVFVAAPPDIWYLKDTNGDGKADIREKVYTGFGTGGSQYILNNLQWGLDHKIYASVAGNGGFVRRADRPDEPPVAVSHKDFRFDPVTRAFEAISGGEQFGNTFDDCGNRFLCSQDTPVYQVVFPERYLARNPLLAVPETTRRLVGAGAPIFRTSPVEAWRAIRSSRRLLAQKGSPDASGVSHNVLDGVAGSTVYRGGAFPGEFYGNLFSGDAQNNLVHRRSLVPDGVLFRSERLDQGTEFLRSKDNWFRPVNFVNAPDGTLYVLDLAREVLEAVHIPMDVVSHLDLTSGRDRGRIFRVKPKGFTRPAAPKLSEFRTGELVACLENPNSWWRDTAHRLLYERQDKSAKAPLRRLLRESPRPQARLHALWSLEGLKDLSGLDILAELSDASPPVRENALQLAGPLLEHSSALLPHCVELATDPDARVRFQLAFALGESKDYRAVKALAVIAKHDAADEYIRTAVLSSSYDFAAPLIRELLKDSQFIESGPGTALLEELARLVGGRNLKEQIRSVLSAPFSAKAASAQESVAIGLSEGLRTAGAPPSSWTALLENPAQPLLQRLISDALQALQAKEPAPERIKKALQVLQATSSDTATAPVLALLDRFPPAQVQVAAIQTLSQLNVAGLEESLLSRWRAVSPEGRRQILSALLSKPQRLDALLSAIETSRIMPGEVDASSRAALLRQTDPALHRRAAAIWGEQSAGSRKEVIQQFRKALELTGNAQAGQHTFERLCTTCHRLNGIGTELGPNLALASSRSPEELLANILDPNLEVDPRYIQYLVETTDGETLAGLLVADQAASVTLKGPNFEQTIPRQRIKQISSGGLSLMPVGLEQGLSPQDFADLISFLMESQYDFGTSGRSFVGDMPERPSAPPRPSLQTYTFKTLGSQEAGLQADVHRPPGDAIRPVVVFIHGGALMMGDRKLSPRPGSLLEALLNAGYVVVSIEYRLAPKVKLPDIIADVRDACAWVRERGPELFGIDPTQMFVMGQSAGGYLTQMSGFCVKPRPRALVSFWGYGDIAGEWYSRPDPFYCQQPLVTQEEADAPGSGKLYLYCRQKGLWPKVVTGHDPDTEPRAFDGFCPVRNVTRDYPPTLLIHGTKDTDVPYALSVQMDKELQAKGVEHQLITIPEGGHGFRSKVDAEITSRTYQQVVQFLDNHRNR